jgi:hypothetical protein
MYEMTAGYLNTPDQIFLVPALFPYLTILFPHAGFPGGEFCFLFSGMSLPGTDRPGAPHEPGAICM